MDHRRLDVWLWYARISRQRTHCASLVAGGRIRINRQPTTKPHARVHVGDIITLPAIGGRGVRALRVMDLGERRGSATDAALLFEEIEEG